jgi:hypothetical protein
VVKAAAGPPVRPDYAAVEVVVSPHKATGRPWPRDV